MINPLVRHGVATVLCLGITGVFLLCTKYAEQHPYTRIYRTVPLTLTWAMGACSLYLLLQTIFPFLDTPWFDTLGVFLPFGFAILVAIFFLWRRTRYIEDTATLLVLLFALFVLTLINSAGILPHPSSPPPIIAFYATWCAIGSVFLLPCIWFDRWLLSPPFSDPHGRGDELPCAGCCARLRSLLLARSQRLYSRWGFSCITSWTPS